MYYLIIKYKFEIESTVDEFSYSDINLGVIIITKI